MTAYARKGSYADDLHLRLGLAMTKRREQKHPQRVAARDKARAEKAARRNGGRVR